MSIDQYAVVGNPIAHSKSPQIHRAFAQETQQAINYEPQCVAVDEFTSFADDFFVKGGKGLNATVPFKLDAYHYADRLTDRAKLAGAVNTLIANSDGKIIGDNTDGWGLVHDIVKLNRWEITDKRLLVLGAGGAVRGVLGPLLDQNPEAIVIANRTVVKAVELAELFGPKCEGCGFEALTGEHFDMVINGTAASLANDLPPLPDDLLNQKACCYDMMYSQEPTIFMRWAMAHGAVGCCDGLGMLVSQGAEAFHQWRGVMPAIEPVISLLRDTK